MRRAALAAAAAALLLACGAAPERRRDGPPPDYPGELRPPSALGADVLWRQRVTAAWPDGERGFDAAVQVARGELLVLGLSPLGQPGFVVRWDGERTELEDRSGMETSVPPRWVLLDVQRAFFPWLEGAPPDGERSGEVAGERVVEVARGGRVLERRFARADGAPPGEIRVTCEWGRDDWLAPTRVVLENGWFGYRIEVETLEETRLPEARP